MFALLNDAATLTHHPQVKFNDFVPDTETAIAENGMGGTFES